MKTFTFNRLENILFGEQPKIEQEGVNEYDAVCHIRDRLSPDSAVYPFGFGQYVIQNDDGSEIIHLVRHKTMEEQLSYLNTKLKE